MEKFHKRRDQYQDLMEARKKLCSMKKGKRKGGMDIEISISTSHRTHVTEFVERGKEEVLILIQEFRENIVN